MIKIRILSDCFTEGGVFFSSVVHYRGNLEEK